MVDSLKKPLTTKAEENPETKQISELKSLADLIEEKRVYWNNLADHYRDCVEHYSL